MAGWHVCRVDSGGASPFFFFTTPRLVTRDCETEMGVRGRGLNSREEMWALSRQERSAAAERSGRRKEFSAVRPLPWRLANPELRGAWLTKKTRY